MGETAILQEADLAYSAWLAFFETPLEHVGMTQMTLHSRLDQYTYDDISRDLGGSVWPF